MKRKLEVPLLDQEEKMVGRRQKEHQVFFQFGKRNAEMSSLIKLNIDGQITENPKEINCFVTKFYETLYKKSIDVDHTNFFLSIKENAKSIDEESKKMY